MVTFEKESKMLVFFLVLFSTTLYSSFNVKLNDIVSDYAFSVPEHTYHRYCKNVYSQNGEDGILEQLLKELNITAGTFCEFGASDGVQSSNTYNLIQKGFTGVAIEIDQKRYERCIQNYSAYPDIKVYHGAVLYNHAGYNLDTWLKKADLPYDFDILSIDIDCDDYYVWENMRNFSPKIVILETNSYRDPVYDELPRKISQEYTIDPLKQWCPAMVGIGCSFISAVKLGLDKGYIPVSYTGNITFVRKDLIDKLKEFPTIVSQDPYDYLKLYSHLVLWGNRWKINTGLILNVAIRDYYLHFKHKYIDISWINMRMQEIINNEQVIF